MLDQYEYRESRRRDDSTGYDVEMSEKIKTSKKCHHVSKILDSNDVSIELYVVFEREAREFQSNHILLLSRELYSNHNNITCITHF